MCMFICVQDWKNGILSPTGVLRFGFRVLCHFLDDLGSEIWNIYFSVLCPFLDDLGSDRMLTSIGVLHHFWMTWVLRVRMLVSLSGAVLVSMTGATFG